MFRFAVRPIARTASAFFGVACLAGMFLTASAAQGQGLFQSPSPTLPTGTVPQGVAAADFAHSGFQSLVVTDSTNKNMKVFLATGAATFGSATTYATCTGPTAVVAADLNNDGYADIVIACPTSNAVEVFINQGTSGPGTFGGGVAYTVTDPVALVVGHFTNNAFQPGVAVASGSGGITVFLNEGGTLIIKTAAVTGTLSGITTADYNHDGNLDLAVSDSANNNVHVLTGDGAGDFTLAGSYATGGTAPSGIVSADFNHDGNIDLATSNAGSNNVTVLRGSATATFTAQTPQPAGTNPIAIVETDVNSDGNPDIVAFDSVTASTGGISVLLGNGDGTLQTVQTASQTFVPGTVAAVADFNRDGKPDLAVTQQTANTASLLLNNTLPTQYPDGRSFGAASKLTNGFGNMADGVAVGDFNNDGLLDIAVSYLEDNAVRVLLNNGSGFSAATSYAVGKQPYWVASGDLNGDGYPDLVTANTTDGTVSVLLNNGKSGNGTFAPAATYTVGKQPYQVAIGDVNGDGFPDLAVTNYGANTVTILLGSKTGTFTPAATTLATCANPYGVAIGDFEHNGFPSVAVTCYSAAELEVFPNSGSGTFGTPFMIATDVNPSSLVVGDFNRDGKLDIVVGNTTANDIYFFAGKGDNTFAAGVESPSLNFPDSIAAGDVNGDGILDIVGVAPNFNDVVVTLGKGDGTFGTFQQRAAGEFGAAKQPWAVALGDFNNDGQLDIVTANTFNQVNIASPAFQARYMAEYPAIPAGNQSIDVLTNDSSASISLAISPTPPLPFNNTGATLTTTVQPALSGGTPTGSVIFEDATGTPYGPGPYPLTGGVATASTGRLGSGQYLFTTLYSGDASFQPTTASGAGFAVIVAGTPVTLTLTPSSVAYASTFTVGATVTGTSGSGAPLGTVTVFGVNGGTTFTLGTITLTASGNNGIGTGTYTAVSPNLNVGTYEIYGYYTPSNSYPAGSSPNVLLTVTGEPTSTAISCTSGFFGGQCVATVTASTTHTPVPAGLTVNFVNNGGAPIAETTNANGQASYNFGSFIGTFTVVATFPTQGNYLTSNASQTFFCVLCLARGTPFSLTSFGAPGSGGVENTGRALPFSIF